MYINMYIMYIGYKHTYTHYIYIPTYTYICLHTFTYTYLETYLTYTVYMTKWIKYNRL